MDRLRVLLKFEAACLQALPSYIEVMIYMFARPQTGVTFHFVALAAADFLIVCRHHS